MLEPQPSQTFKVVRSLPAASPPLTVDVMLLWNSSLAKMIWLQQQAKRPVAGFVPPVAVHRCVIAEH